MSLRRIVLTLLFLGIVAGSVELTIGWDRWIDGVTHPETYPVAIVSTPGATTLTVLANARTSEPSRDGLAALLARMTRGMTAEPTEARVRFDGRATGRTPILDRPVDPGPLTVEVHQSGYLDESVPLRLQPDHSHQLHVVLFPRDQVAKREAFLRERRFVGVWRYVFQLVLISVAAFHLVSVLWGRRPGLLARIGIAAFHIVLTVAGGWLGTHLALPMDGSPWILATLALGLFVLLPFAWLARLRRRSART